MDLWDYQDRRGSVWRDARVAGYERVVLELWSLGMTTWRNQMTSTRCNYPTCMYMHMVEDHETHDTMSMQQEDNTAVRK